MRVRERRDLQAELRRIARHHTDALPTPLRLVRLSTRRLRPWTMRPVPSPPSVAVLLISAVWARCRNCSDLRALRDAPSRPRNHPISAERGQCALRPGSCRWGRFRRCWRRAADTARSLGCAIRGRNTDPVRARQAASTGRSSHPAQSVGEVRRLIEGLSVSAHSRWLPVGQNLAAADKLGSGVFDRCWSLPRRFGSAPTYRLPPLPGLLVQPPTRTLSCFDGWFSCTYEVGTADDGVMWPCPWRRLAMLWASRAGRPVDDVAVEFAVARR